MARAAEGRDGGVSRDLQGARAGAGDQSVHFQVIQADGVHARKIAPGPPPLSPLRRFPPLQLFEGTVHADEQYRKLGQACCAFLQPGHVLEGVLYDQMVAHRS